MLVNKQAEYIQAVSWFQQQFSLNFITIVQETIPEFVLPQDIALLKQNIARLMIAVQDRAFPEFRRFSAEDLLPVLKRALLEWRRFRTAEYERFKDATVNAGLLEGYDDKVRDLDDMLNDAVLSDINPVKMPLLLDYITIQKLESLPQVRNQLADRHYDEKFHILQAPDLFLRDLNFFRTKCELRSVPLMIAFLDIDHFKKLNSELGHDTVDRSVLPFFMRELESRVYNHGYAYRFGGDEYMVLLPNFSRDVGFVFLDDLRRKLAEQRYQVEGRTTVSIGVCCVEEDCPLTDRELRERASHAMQFAKDNGRNRIATYQPSKYADQDLQLVEGREAFAFEATTS